MKMKHATGFTLVEIMVSLAIAALLLSGIIQVFITLKNTDNVSNALSRVQEGGRVALDMISHDLRMAGFRGCVDPNLEANTEIIATSGLPAEFIGASLTGFDVTADNWGAGTVLADIDDSSADSATARLASDVVNIMRFDADAYPVSSHAPATRTIVVTGLGADLAVNRFAAISDCSTASLFRITSSSASGNSTTLQHAATANSAMQYNYASSNAELRPLLSNAYFVGKTGRLNQSGDVIYALFRRDIDGNIAEIVEGVENMQIQYGLEMTSGNRRFVNATTATPNIETVTSARVYLLVASNERILQSDDSNSYEMGDITIEPTASGGAVTYANDRRLRKVFSMTINLRNRRI